MLFLLWASFAAGGDAFRLRSNRSRVSGAGGPNSEWFLGGAGQSCAAFCSAKGAGCTESEPMTLGDTDDEIKKSAKKIAKDLGVNCQGWEMATDLAKGSPQIHITNEKKMKGPCLAPSTTVGISCDTEPAAAEQRFCFCNALEPVLPEYDPVWKPEWVHPDPKAKDFLFESCVCYAQKGVDGIDAIPPEPLTHNPGETEKDCATYCVEHASGKYLAADLFMLHEWSKTERPAIVVVHGKGGHKDEQWITWVAKYLGEAGYIVMVINYDTDKCDADIGNAVRYLRYNAESLGVNPKSIGLYGWSQGGRCAFKAAYLNQMQEGEFVSAIVSHAGCGGKGPIKEAKKYTVPAPALMLLHATKDPTVSWDDCVAVAEMASSIKTEKKEPLTVVEEYFPIKTHNLIGLDKTAAQARDLLFDHYAQYLGRPCTVGSKKTWGGAKKKKIKSKMWPVCKTWDGPQPAKCGGVYSSVSELTKDC